MVAVFCFFLIYKLLLCVIFLSGLLAVCISIKTIKNLS